MQGCDMRKRRSILAVGLILSALGLFLSYEYILDQQSITWQDYMKVHDGMSQHEVEAILGPPRSIATKQHGGSEVCWIGRKQGMISIEFTAAGAIDRKSFIEDARDYRLSFFPRVRDN
jgi:hypothetical protein